MNTQLLESRREARAEQKAQNYKQAADQLFQALKLVAKQNCQAKSEIKDMIANMRRIAREAIDAHEINELSGVYESSLQG